MTEEKVTGRVYNLYHYTDESVIQLINNRIYTCKDRKLCYYIMNFVRNGMIVTLHLKGSEITQIDIKV